MGQQTIFTRDGSHQLPHSLLVLLVLLVVPGLVWLTMPPGAGSEILAPLLMQWRDLSVGHPILTALGFAVIFAAFAACGLPRMYPAVLAGGLFGAPVALCLALIGAAMGCLVPYRLTRALGDCPGAADRNMESARWANGIARNGFAFVLLLRLLPGMNALVTSSLGGILGVKVTAFLLATVLGILPSTLGYVLLGEGIATGSSLTLALSMTLLGVIGGGAVACRRFRSGETGEEIPGRGSSAIATR